MKKLLLVILTVVLAPIVQAATEYDFLKGFDFTGASSVSGTKLNQLVDNASLVSNKGILIYTNVTPDTTNNTRFTRYIWMNTNFDPPQPYVYKTNGGFWTNISAIATIGANTVAAGALQANSVYTSNLVDNAVTDVKIIAGSVTSSKIASGSISNTHIAGLTIQSTNIANGQILSTNIAASAILGYHMASGQIGLSSLTNGFLLYGSNIANVTIGSNHIAGAGLNITNLPTGTISAAYMQSGVLPSSTNFTGVAMPKAGATTTVTHSLPGTPSSCRVVLYCDTADAATGYIIGDMIELPYVGLPGSSMQVPEFSVWNTQTTVRILRHASGGTFLLYRKSDGAITAVSSAANFNFRVYLTYVP